MWGTIRIFHPNYIPVVKGDFDREKPLHPGNMSRDSLRKQALVLTPFQGTLAEYERALTGLTQSLFFINYAKEPCAWKSIPRLSVALHRVKSVLVRDGRGDTVPSFYKQALANQDLCGDAEKFFREYFENE